MLFPIVALLLVIYIWLVNFTIFTSTNNISSFYLNNLQKGHFGFGLEANYNNQISFEGLEPGDILLGGYPKCGYGRFSHTGIYLGDNLVLESYGDLGITIQPIYHYWDYSEIALLKVNTTKDIKEKVVNYVRKYEGGLFYPVAFKPGDRFWNCSKIIWKAYLKEGIDLDDSGDLWTAPEIFYYSPWTTVIREKGR
ncbi:MAG TPA: hypothetical protein VFC73_04315 [Syntrophomonadaceae bacterium]|nr:hypothetical protein [Syntrophomonadaceae bacterium]